MTSGGLPGMMDGHCITGLPGQVLLTARRVGTQEAVTPAVESETRWPRR